MKRVIIILIVILLFIINGCSNKSQVTGSAIKEINNTKKLPYMMDSNICLVIDDVSSPIILNKNCRVDSDCYGAARAFGVEDMNTVKCS
ncbi:hypothetical protein HYV88_04010 [Candidatus Woesearchaeota archaeon]|nr:hypothetical protein [Candidatus Woesearchaeota archaeon]